MVCTIVSGVIFFLVELTTLIWFIVKVHTNRNDRKRCFTLFDHKEPEYTEIRLEEDSSQEASNTPEIDDAFSLEKLYNWKSVTVLTFGVATFILFIVALCFLIPFYKGGNKRDYSGCDPIDDSDCLLPYPSSFYLKNDPTTPTGFRVSIGSKVLPVLRYNKRLSTRHLNEKDGFSVASTLMFRLVGGTTRGQLSYSSIENYKNPDVNSVLINLDTKELVPHFIELDMTTTADTEKPFLVNPAILLDYNAHYLFAVRNIVNRRGVTLGRKGSFKEFLESGSERAAQFLGTDGYLQIVEDAVNWRRDEIQIAWDFRTNSQESVSRRSELLRDDVARRFSQGMEYKIDKVVKRSKCTGKSDHIWRQVHGHIQMPLYVEHRNGEMKIPLDATKDDIVPQKERHFVAFIAEIPCSLYREPAEAKLVQVGHGLLVDRGEVRSKFIREFADQTKAVTYSADWFTMSSYDLLPMVKLFFTEPERLHNLIDSAVQGHLNQYAIDLLMQKWLSRESVFTVDGVSLLPAHEREVQYIGSSLGGITGAAYVSLNPRVKRAYFTVPSAGFANTCTRSAFFGPLNLGLDFVIHHQKDIRLLFTVIQVFILFYFILLSSLYFVLFLLH